MTDSDIAPQRWSKILFPKIAVILHLSVHSFVHSVTILVTAGRISVWIWSLRFRTSFLLLFLAEDQIVRRIATLRNIAITSRTPLTNRNLKTSVSGMAVK